MYVLDFSLEFCLLKVFEFYISVVMCIQSATMVASYV